MTDVVLVDEGGLALDHDGTLTWAEIECGPFGPAFFAVIAEKLRQPLDFVLERAKKIYEETILPNPARFGWVLDDPFVFNGETFPRQRFMAPATPDPMLRCNAIGRELLRGVMDPAEIGKFLNGAYGVGYEATIDAPKEGLAEFLEEVCRRKMRTRIATNSATDAVQRKLLRHLGESELYRWWHERVVGGARKFDPTEIVPKDDSPESLAAAALWPADYPAEIELPGFPRATVIKRPRLLKFLVEFKASIEKDLGHEIPWSRIVFVGDIFDIDLVLALWLGCHVGFMTNEFSPAWEVAYITNHPRGIIMTGVAEILPFYDYVQSLPA
ncbi:MAG: hypothetical protein AAB431_03960 [Patescibacteria group bacterium]